MTRRIVQALICFGAGYAGVQLLIEGVKQMFAVAIWIAFWACFVIGLGK